MAEGRSEERRGMNNLWLGGPVRSLAFVVLGLLSSASTATADLVAQGVGAKPTTIASVGVSNEPERAGDFDRHAMSFETSSTQRSAHAHLQMAGDVPGAYELEFDLNTPWQNLPDNVKKVILYGSGRTRISFSYRNRPLC